MGYYLFSSIINYQNYREIHEMSESLKFEYLFLVKHKITPTLFHFLTVPPTIHVRHQSYLIGLGQKVTLECITESYPSSFNYWLHNDNENEIVQGTTDQVIMENVYRVVMKLTIRPTKLSDFGSYKCVAKNSLGEGEEVITVDREFIFNLRKSVTVISNQTLLQTKSASTY